jgi:hypothetical protein
LSFIGWARRDEALLDLAARLRANTAITASRQHPVKALRPYRLAGH